MDFDIDERFVQTSIMRRCLGYRHSFAIPNFKGLFYWECDVMSVTKAGLVHEYEVKLSGADFYADFRKRKHYGLEKMNSDEGERFSKLSINRFSTLRGESFSVPNYFWYVTCGMRLNVDDIPWYAGWINVETSDGRWRYEGMKHVNPIVKRSAPRLHGKVIEMSEQLRRMGRSISYSLMNAYSENYPNCNFWK